jgi:hypothetical protein
MAGSDNIIPLNRRTKEEQKAITTAGGIASGESRRARKTLKEELLLLLSEGDTQKSVTVALLQKAMDGDVKAFEVLRDTIGEKPVDKVENKNVDIVIDLGDLEDAD